MKLDRAVDSSKSERVRALVDDLIRRPGGYSDSEGADLENKHPELMPELGQRLRTLRALDAAALETRQRKPSSECNADSSQGAFADEMEVLREALPSYELIDQIQYGGQGVVYKAVQSATGRMVAIKVLVDGPLASERQRLRFEREVELTARLSHPNIVTVYESGIVRGRRYCAMEFIDGVAIDDFVLLPDQTAEKTLTLFAKVCKAVNFAHQNGVIHRDLNPSNILEDSDGEPHILDFGLARDAWADAAEHSSADLSLSMAVMGTLPYLSPEQALGNSSRADVRSDTYALGVVLHRLLTGLHPYPVDGPAEEVRKRIVELPPARLTASLRAEDFKLPRGRSVKDLDIIIRRALAKAPNERYQTAAELGDDIERFLSGDAIRARADSAWYVVRKSLRRHRGPMTVAAISLTVVVVAMSTVIYQWGRASALMTDTQAILATSGALRVASVARDAGQLDDAAEYLLSEIALAERAPGQGVQLRRQIYNGYHVLSRIYGTQGDEKNARRMRQTAITYGTSIRDELPGDDDRLRFGAFLDFLCAQDAVAAKDWKGAVDKFQASAKATAQLLDSDPQNVVLRVEHAQALSWLGEYRLRVGEFGAALTDLQSSYDIRRKLAEANPEQVEYTLELARAEINLGAWNMWKKPVTDDDLALAYFSSAQDRVQALMAVKLPLVKQPAAAELLNAISTNIQRLSSRRGAHAS